MAASQTFNQFLGGSSQKAPLTPVNTKSLKVFRGLFYWTLILVLVTIAFLIYLAVTDTQLKDAIDDWKPDTSGASPPKPTYNSNYKAVNLAAIVIASFTGLFILVTAAVGGMKHLTKQPPGSIQTTQTQVVGGGVPQLGVTTPYLTAGPPVFQ
jgi:hypothetical protein